MKMTTTMFAGLGVLLLASGLVAADPTPQCPYDHQAFGYYFIVGPPAEVWKESNGVPGLQKHPWTDDRGQVHPADKAVLIFD